MTIGFVVTALGSGGTEHWVELATGELVRRGHAVTVIAEHPPHSGRARLEALGASVHAFDTTAPLRTHVHILQQAHAEVVHLHVWERANELSRLGRLVGAPLVLSYHHVPPRPWRTWAARLAKPWRLVDSATRHLGLARNVDAHVACCASAVAGIRGELWPLWRRRVHSVPNGVPIPPQISDKSEGPARFLQVGALVERKDPEATLRAFAEFGQDCGDAELIFVGDGALRDRLVASAPRLHNDHRRIRFVGQVEDVRPFYEWGNICVLPSRDEGLPYSLLEAAAHGLALIATDVGGNREVAVGGRTGLMVPRGDRGALPRAMAILAGDPALRAEMGRIGRALVKARFGLASHVDQLLALYQRLPHRPTPVPRSERSRNGQDRRRGSRDQVQ